MNRYALFPDQIQECLGADLLFVNDVALFNKDPNRRQVTMRDGRVYLFVMIRQAWYVVLGTTLSEFTDPTADRGIPFGTEVIFNPRDGIVYYIWAGDFLLQADYLTLVVTEPHLFRDRK